MTLLTGCQPEAAGTVKWQEWQLKIVDKDGKIIDKVLACRLSNEPMKPNIEMTASSLPQAW